MGAGELAHPLNGCLIIGYGLAVFVVLLILGVVYIKRTGGSDEEDKDNKP